MGKFLGLHPTGSQAVRGRGQLQLLSVRNRFTVPILLSKEPLVFSLIKHFCHPLHRSLPKHPPVALIKLSIHMHDSGVGVIRQSPRLLGHENRTLKPLATNRRTGRAPECEPGFASRDRLPSQSPISPSNKQLDSWMQKGLRGAALGNICHPEHRGSPLGGL